MSNNLKQACLGMHSYHNQFETLPAGAYYWGWGTWQVAILPYVELGPLFDMYDQGGKATCDPTKIYYGAINRKVCSVRLAAFTCPSDMPQAVPFSWSPPSLTQHNYAVNYGNTGYLHVGGTGPAMQVPGTPPIVFGGAAFEENDDPAKPVYVRFADIVDGLSNTLMFGEVIQGQSISVGATDARGLTWWADAAGFETLLPPNSNSPDVMVNLGNCQTNWDVPCDPVPYSSPNRPANFAARSRHPGGVGVGMCDGSVSFISDTIAIDAWRALSTTKGGEVVNNF